MDKLKFKKLPGNPLAKPQAMVQGDCYRFTVLTPNLIRLEYNENGLFEDRSTQTVLNRNFDVPHFRVIDTSDRLQIVTDSLRLVYNKQPFSTNGLSIEVGGGLSAYSSTWFYGMKLNTLKGTVRTLDEADGAVPLDDGLLSADGFSVIDDSSAMLLTEDGWVAPRPEESIDLYFLGYGRNYLDCLKDFFKLCGPTPMLPRYALGNWWSRYRRYSEQEYRELMGNFKKHGVPLSVAVLDMDWHLTEIAPKYGSGWTGYTWNTELFPDPAAFLKWLHENNLHVTLNVHPADGARGHEQMYRPMAQALGMDASHEDKIEFDASNPEFMQAYFRYLHHPHEKIGVDFWWLDWQQKGGTRVERLNPLWILNHYHYLDSGRDSKRPLTFSRYAGIGSHRYPIGFSGDTIVSWASLAFQPYFTATASNAGYGWWSHDIGGHMHGIRDDEMATRWVQFGVFSPIMRLHSSNNPFTQKEPWLFSPVARDTMIKFMRLRHRMVPYLYTMAHRFHTQGEPLIQPMYYQHPYNHEAYGVPNQYYFGQGLIVCPITSPADPRLGKASFCAWLPEGRYYDIFNGWRYPGGRKIDLYRELADIPVFAKAGTILPLNADELPQNGVDTPCHLELWVFTGADGTFTLYEDNGADGDLNQSWTTALSLHPQDGAISFVIAPVQGTGTPMPKERTYTLRFYGIQDAAQIQALSAGNAVAAEKSADATTGALVITLAPVATDAGCTITLTDVVNQQANLAERAFDLLAPAQIEYDHKWHIHSTIQQHANDAATLLTHLQAMHLEPALMAALTEVIAASLLG